MRKELVLLQPRNENDRKEARGIKGDTFINRFRF